MFTKDGKRFNIQVLKGKRAPDGSLRADYPNAQDLIDLGIAEIPDPIPPAGFSDETHYRTESDDPPYVVYTKKSDEQLVEIAQTKLNQASLSYLSETDWLITRFAETGVPIPDEVKVKRQAARDSIIVKKEVIQDESVPVINDTTAVTDSTQA